MNARAILLVINPNRPEALSAGQELGADLTAAGFEVFATQDCGVQLFDFESHRAFEVLLVLGGDGTILRAAEIIEKMQSLHGEDSHPVILGINLGTVGFLAEIARPSSRDIAQALVERNYHAENRILMQFSVSRAGAIVHEGWALNEVAVARSTVSMIELFLQIDHRPLSRWGCDGIVCATPTGSTAYAFSAGGPILWPEVEAFVVLPLSAHALFSRPLVVSPYSEIAIDVESEEVLLSADGLRKFSLHKSDRITITKHPMTIGLAHIENAVFSDRLVAKFKLPIEGWRGE